MWHEKEPSLLKAMSANHRSKFAALSPVMVTAAAGYLKNCSGGYKQTNKQTNYEFINHMMYRIQIYLYNFIWLYVPPKEEVRALL